MERLKYGDLVLVYLDNKRRKVIRLREGGVYTSDKGVLRHDDVVGLSYGSSVILSTGFKAYLLRPTLEDLLREFSRRTQVIYPKDIGLMIVKLGAGPRMRCLEGGTGSGYVTASLSWVGCKVATFEMRREHLEVAKKNLRRFGLDKNVVFVRDTLANAPRVFGEEVFDLAVVDVGDPWNVVEGVWKALKGGAPTAFWLPTTNQLEKLKKALEGRFLWIEALEVTERRMRVSVGAVRPEQFGITFTGYLVIARKIS
ncbi:protein L-isoaspartate methyltransferase [Ignicoccus pacificus DSM 13166]|uniref:Protein L-isoaspartate methyltransferase n=1 Tax=Ignicoccus pacificus DSM 13166 TaxID=940294 RepID=A0A977PJZ7_9CREN|nr:protein L-isoaspartate methyltransferase [Ignicoccus pacificus DSM 13166]